MDQSDPALGGLQGGLKKGRVGRVVCRPADYQRQIADYDGQQIIEIVSNSAGQLADGFELLSLAQDGLGGLAFCDLGLQAKISLIQLKARRIVSAKNRFRCRPAKASAAAKIAIIAPSALPVTEPSLKKRTAIGKLADSRKAIRVGR